MNNDNAGKLQLLSLINNDDFKVKKNFIDNLYSDNLNTEKISINIVSKNNARWGNTISYEIPKEQDLINDMYLYVKLPGIDLSNTNLKDGNYGFKWVDYIGMKLLKCVQLYIGNKLIDEYDPLYSFLYSTIYDSNSSKDFLLGLDPVLTNVYTSLPDINLYIPFNFWFCTDLNAALPLTNHNDNVEIKIELNDWNNCYQIFSLETGEQIFENTQIQEIQLGDIYLVCNYIILDQETHKKFLKEEFDILIKNNQLLNFNLSNNTFELKFNNLVKEIWFVIQSTYIKYNLKDYFNLSNYPSFIFNDWYNFQKIATNNNVNFKSFPSEPRNTNFLKNASIYLNNIPLLYKQDYKYFFLFQNYMFFRKDTSTNIYLYSFKNFIGDDLNSGINFNNLNAILQIELNRHSTNFLINSLNINKSNNSDFELSIYALSYNVLSIRNKKVSLKYIY